MNNFLQCLRSSNCPTNNGVPDEETHIWEIKQGQSSVPPSSADNSAKAVKKKGTKELRRKALQERKQVKKVDETSEVPVEAQGQVPVEITLQEPVAMSANKTKHANRQKP